METNFTVRTFDVDIPVEEYRALPRHNLYIILDNLRSAFNVGAIFRLADTMRVAELFLCGYTAYPPHTKLAKTSLGTIDYVPWRHFPTTMDAVAHCRAQDIHLWGAETTSHSHLYTEVRPPRKVALILGNEALGISEPVLKACDLLIEIPTFGYKNSLNVATACSVLGYTILEKMEVFTERNTP
ncbi:RNA methyltransferase [Chitinivibrio alkaliphilus]|nr:RNA methyltransferase [Chitinivibrio alkaliphilus]